MINMRNLFDFVGNQQHLSIVVWNHLSTVRFYLFVIGLKRFNHVKIGSRQKPDLESEAIYFFFNPEGHFNFPQYEIEISPELIFELAKILDINLVYVEQVVLQLHDSDGKILIAYDEDTKLIIETPA